MWLFLPFGFYSIVKKYGDKKLCVRARIAGDLDNLRDFAPELGPTQAGSGTDYYYRAYIEPEALAKALGRITLDINYDNFKNEVRRQQGAMRSTIYGDVWYLMAGLESKVMR